MCNWKNTLVVFNDNTVKTRIPLEHIQGQLDQSAAGLTVWRSR